MVVQGPLLSALFTMSEFVNLDCLYIWELDLTKEHWAIMRGPLTRSVTKLKLLNLHSCTVSSFLRFLNSFGCLTELVVEFNYYRSLSHDGQILPPPRPAPNRVLKCLNPEVIPGVGKLIEWYIREGCFLAILRKLVLRWHYSSTEKGTLYLQSDGHMALLRHCAETLEDLTISISPPDFPRDETSSTSAGTLVHIARVHDSIVILPSLPNLRRIWWGWSGEARWAKVYCLNLLAIVAKQLGLITSPCKIIEMRFSISDLGGLEEAKGQCRLIDEVLTGVNFPELRHVKLFHRLGGEHFSSESLYHGQLSEYFPILQSCGLLELVEK